MLLGGEIIEKGSLSYIGRFGDVLHGGFQEAAFGEERECGAVEAVASFGAMAFAAAAARGAIAGTRGGGQGGGFHEHTIIDYRASPTDSQDWTLVTWESQEGPLRVT